MGDPVDLAFRAKESAPEPIHEKKPAPEIKVAPETKAAPEERADLSKTAKENKPRNPLAHAIEDRRKKFGETGSVAASFAIPQLERLGWSKVQIVEHLILATQDCRESERDSAMALTASAADLLRDMKGAHDACIELGFQHSRYDELKTEVERLRRIFDNLKYLGEARMLLDQMDLKNPQDIERRFWVTSLGASSVFNGTPLWTMEEGPSVGELLRDPRLKLFLFLRRNYLANGGVLDLNTLRSEGGPSRHSPVATKRSSIIDFNEKDGTADQTAHYQSITFQQPYQNKSFEELRVEDYMQGRRYGNTNGQAGSFGQTTGSSGSAFGSTDTSATPSVQPQIQLPSCSSNGGGGFQGGRGRHGGEYGGHRDGGGPSDTPAAHPNVTPNLFTDEVSSGGQPNAIIYVKNLHWGTSNDDLVELFQTSGTVERAEVQYKANGRPRGAGVIQFASQGDATTAIMTFQGYSYGGRPLHLDYARYPNPGATGCQQLMTAKLKSPSPTAKPSMIAPSRPMVAPQGLAPTGKKFSRRIINMEPIFKDFQPIMEPGDRWRLHRVPYIPIQSHPDGPTIRALLDTGACVTNASKQWLVENYPEASIRPMDKPLELSGSFGSGTCTEFATVVLLFPVEDAKGACALARVEEEVHLFGGADRAIAIGADIIGSRNIKIDLDERKAWFGSHGFSAPLHKCKRTPTKVLPVPKPPLKAPEHGNGSKDNAPVPERILERPAVYPKCPTHMPASPGNRNGCEDDSMAPDATLQRPKSSPTGPTNAPESPVYSLTRPTHALTSPEYTEINKILSPATKTLVKRPVYPA